MNILPKKRWHVRTKENIARVRKDEAEAAEKERQEQLRIENANREARLNALKNKSKHRLEELGLQSKEDQPDSTSSQHINLFTDIGHAVKLTNKEHEQEVKEKNEEYEKKIGYLTYLGQDTNEALKKKNWYEVSPSSRFSAGSNIKDTYEKLVLKDRDGLPKEKPIDVHNGELDWKFKQRHDPINKFKKFCKEIKTVSSKSKLSSVTKLKTKKCKESKNEKELILKNLREARLKREQEERHRTDMFLSNLNKTETQKKSDTTVSSSKIKPKYNSQFNPELARQNYR